MTSEHKEIEFITQLDVVAYKARMYHRFRELMVELVGRDILDDEGLLDALERAYRGL